jgi:crotonobetainyl-CoA:carnitine CoA-transferase CaiB-like acyl-CoA transferase
VFRRLVEVSDVVGRASVGVMERFGLDYWS